MNFAVLVCSSVPSLKKSIKGLEENIVYYERLPTADYFKETKVFLLKEYLRYYKLNLGKHLILSAFSFYEDYITSAIEELFEFHGGKDNFLRLTERKTKATLDIDTMGSERGWFVQVGSMTKGAYRILFFSQPV